MSHLTAGSIECATPSGTEPEYTGPISSRWTAPERPKFADPAKIPSEAQVHNRKVLGMSQLLKSRGLLKPKTCARTVTPAAVRDDEAALRFHAAASELKPPVGKVPAEDEYRKAWEKDFTAARASHERWQETERRDLESRRMYGGMAVVDWNNGEQVYGPYPDAGAAYDAINELVGGGRCYAREEFKVVTLAGQMG